MSVWWEGKTGGRPTTTCSEDISGVCVCGGGGEGGGAGVSECVCVVCVCVVCG